VLLGNTEVTAHAHTYQLVMGNINLSFNFWKIHACAYSYSRSEIKNSNTSYMT